MEGSALVRHALGRSSVAQKSIACSPAAEYLVRRLPAGQDGVIPVPTLGRSAAAPCDGVRDSAPSVVGAGTQPGLPSVALCEGGWHPGADIFYFVFLRWCRQCSWALKCCSKKYRLRLTFFATSRPARWYRRFFKRRCKSATLCVA